MRRRLTPGGSQFFDKFTLLAQVVVRGADVLAQLLGAEAQVRPELGERLRAIEHEADETAHSIIQDLSRTFVTPFDRDDIYRLTSSLDDCMDAMEEAGDRVVLYGVGRLPAPILDQMRVLQRAAELTAQAMPSLRVPERLGHFWVEVNRLENEADRSYRDLLAQLFADPSDPIELMKLKEIGDLLEQAADAFEQVAGAVETIALKES